MSAAADFDASTWVGRTTRVEVRMVRETLEWLEASLDRPVAAPGAPMAPLRHWLWLFAPPAVPGAALRADGHGGGEAFTPAWPLPRRMWAGSSVEFLEPVPPDTVLTRQTVLESATTKAGRTGTLGFTVQRHRWHLPDGRCAIDDAQTVVYRESVPPGTSPRTAGPLPAPADAPAPAWESLHRPDPVLLFRYSALSFNSHRIHYDLPYASGVEGYPGLVVHGPLMATLMLDAFRDAHPGATVRRFAFRALAPAFAGDVLRCGGCPTEDGRARLWIRDDAGHEHLAGEVSFD